MEFGVFLPYQVFHEGAEADTLFARMLDHAITGDKMGVRRVWTPEHHFVHFLQSPSALLTAVHIGQHVRCRVGTGVIVLPFHDPLHLAGEIALTDHILEGRLDLGVARGAYGYEFTKLGYSFESSLPRFIETLEGLRTLLLNEAGPASFDGEYVNFPPSYIWPRPRQRPHPPLWMGAQSVPAIRDAARRGYNVLHSGFLWGDDHVASVMQAFRDGQEDGGSADTKLGITRFACLVDNEREVDERLEELLYGWRIHIQLHNFDKSADPRGVVASRPAAEEPELAQLRRNLLIGTEEHVAEKLEYYADLGVSVVNLNAAFGAEHAAALDGLRRFEPFIAKYDGIR